MTTADGQTTDYYSRHIAGNMRTEEIDGSCNCGSEDVVYAYDARGNVIREQDAHGLITIRSFSRGRLTSTSTYYRPETCEPETSPTRCRLSPEALVTETLVPTSLSTTTTLIYGDANWPDRPTVQATDSLLAGRQAQETFTFDAATGAVLSSTRSGFDPTNEGALSRTTTTLLYDGVQAAGFDPCAGVTGTCDFPAAWVTLPQPAGWQRRTDGPRSDVEDWTTEVYYPFDAAVPVDARGRLAAVRNAVGHVTRFEDYDVFGNARRIIDANGVVTETTYDPLGRLLTSTLKGIPGCDTALDPLCATDVVTRRMYDPAAGPLAIEIGPRGEATTYEYDSRGRMTTLRRGAITGAIPNTAAAAIAAAVWREKLTYAYSAETGHKVSETLFAWESTVWVQKKTTSFAYDTSGHLATTTYADGNSVAYEYDRGQLSKVRDENHTTANTVYAYDGATRLTSVSQTLVSAPNGTIATSYGYDRHGNLTSVKDPNGNITAYTYDDFGQMVKQESPAATGTTTYAYDVAGNLTSVTDSNAATTTRTYDAAGRPLTATSTRSGKPNEVVTWTYDDATAGRFGLGRFASMADPAGTTTYAYERRGMLRMEQRTFAGTTEPYVTTFRYDASGNRASMTYPSGLTVTQTFDDANRPSAAATQTTQLNWWTAYLPFGPANDILYANGTHQTMAYDARYRITKNKLTGPSGTIAEYDYLYDAAGNITQIADAVDAGYTRTFAYDDLNRLVTANTGASLWRAGSYTYDAMGNMLSSKLGDPELSFRVEEAYFTYVGTTPRIAKVRRTPLADDFTELSRPARPSRIERQGVGYQTVTYDTAGNELAYVATRSYSPRNLLASVTDAAEVPTDLHRLEYAYDGRGVRVVGSETQANGTKPTRYFFYSPELQLLSTTADDAPNVYSLRLRTNAAPAVKYDFVWEGTRPVAELSSTFPTAIHWYFTDHLGTPLLQTDYNGQVVWRAEYEPYGDIWTMRVPSPDDEAPAPWYDQPLRFPGQESAMRWEGTEERYNIFRWYRAGWGRYTQADPIGLNGGNHLYSYTGSQPINGQDPLGLYYYHNDVTTTHDAVNGSYTDLPGRVGVTYSCGCDIKRRGIRLQFDIRANTGVHISVHKPKDSWGYFCDLAAEYNHVAIFDNGVRRAADEVVQYEQQIYATKGDCEAAGKQAWAAMLERITSFSLTASNFAAQVLEEFRHNTYNPCPFAGTP